MRIQRVEAGPKNVGDAAFVHEDRHLRIAHCEFAAVLNFAILHRIAVGQNAIRGLDPLNNIDELFG